MINCIDYSKICFSLKVFKTKGRKNEGMNRIKNVTTFTFSPSILLGGIKTGTLNGNTLLRKKLKEKRISIFHSIISLKNFYRVRKLSFNHINKVNIRFVIFQTFVLENKSK